jgi:ParB family chromosome partitioning protein
VRPEDGNSDGEADQAEGNGVDDANGNATATPQAPALVHSATLVEDLTAQRTEALRLEFANNHHIALASVVHALLLQTVLTHSRDHSCPDIVFTSKSVEASMKAPASTIASLASLNWRSFGDHSR